MHLCDEVEEYRDWFTGRYKAKDPNGEILLDNSIFELREAFDAEKFAVWAEKIQPNYYVVPDVLDEVILKSLFVFSSCKGGNPVEKSKSEKFQLVLSAEDVLLKVLTG